MLTGWQKAWGRVVEWNTIAVFSFVHEWGWMVFTGVREAKDEENST